MTPVYGFGRTFGVLTEASPLFMERSQIFSTTLYTKNNILTKKYDSYAIVFWLNTAHEVSRGN